MPDNENSPVKSLNQLLQEGFAKLGTSGCLISGEAPRWNKPIPGESANSVLSRLPVVHLDALYHEAHKWQCFKVISIYYAMAEQFTAGDFAQFGVFKGFTARLIEKMMPKDRKLHLFDSFEGLPEDWIGQWKKGSFNVNGQLPDLLRADTVVHKGWFSETCPPFAKEFGDQLAFLHLDADLYSSTTDVLYSLNEKIPSGALLLFDEYLMNGQDDEHRALIDWKDKFDRKIEYLWRTKWMQVAVRVVD